MGDAELRSSDPNICTVPAGRSAPESVELCGLFISGSKPHHRCRFAPFALPRSTFVARRVRIACYSLMATLLLRRGVAGAPNLPRVHIHVGSCSKSIFSYQRPRLSHPQNLFRGQQHQIRTYRRQIFNYRTFQATRGILMRWSAMPTFKYQIGGLVGACTAFYTINLESVPVSRSLAAMFLPCSRLTGVRTTTL